MFADANGVTREIDLLQTLSSLERRVRVRLLRAEDGAETVEKGGRARRGARKGEESEDGHG